MVPVNPWRGIPPFAEEEYVKHVPSADDLNRVLAAAEPWEASLLTVLLCTGTRGGEVLKLRWDDVSARACNYGRKSGRAVQNNTVWCPFLAGCKPHWMSRGQ